MPRRTQTQSQIGGPIQITPGTTPVSTYADPRTARLTSPEIVNLLPLSDALVRIVGNENAKAVAETEEVIRTIAQRVEKGENLDAVLKEYSDSEFTSKRVKSQLAKAFTATGISPTANPAYIQQYHAGQGDIRALTLSSKLRTKDVIQQIAKAGADARPGESQQAMMSALQNIVGNSGVYDNLDVFGRQALDSQILDILDRTLAEAQTVHEEMVVQGFRDSTGAQILLRGHSLAQAILEDDEEVVKLALDGLAEDWFNLRITEPDPEVAREIFVDSLMILGQDIADKRGYEAAAEAISRITDDLAEGGANVFDKDVQGRARLLGLESALRAKVEDDARAQYVRDQDTRRATTLDLESRFGRDLSSATLQGPEAVRGVLEAVEGTLGDIKDPVALAAAREWLQQETSAAYAATRNLSDEERLIEGIEFQLRVGDSDGAMEALQQLRREGRISDAAYNRQVTAVETRKAATWVFERTDVRNADREFQERLAASGLYQDEPGKLAATALNFSDKLYADLTEFVEAQDFSTMTTAVAQRTVDQWLRNYYSEAQRAIQDIPKPAVEPTVEVQAQRASENLLQSPESINRDTLPTPSLAGYTDETAPPAFKKLQRAISEIVEPGKPFSPTDARDLSSTLGTISPGKNAPIVNLINRVNGILTNQDLTDAVGNRVGLSERTQAAVEAFAYAGVFSLDELVGVSVAPKTIEAWSLGQSAVELALKTGGWHLYDIDPLRTPIRETSKVWDAVTESKNGTLTLKVTPDNRKIIEGIREVLKRAKLPYQSDEYVAGFIRHQAILLKTLEGK